MSFFTKEVTRQGYSGEYTDIEPRIGRIVTAAVILFLAILLVITSVTKVPTGHTGIVTTFGEVENYTLEAGIHLKAPWQRVIRMDNRVQKQTIELSCFSSDIQEVSMVFTVNYQINKANAMTIYSTIGKSYYNTVIAPTVMESIKTVTAQYTAENLINDRNTLSAGIEKDLDDKLKQYNIELVSSSIEDMDFTDVFTNAVEAKQVAAQNKLKAETESEQKIIEAQAEADRKVIETAAEAEARKLAADAEAYEIATKAAAEAEANEKIAKSITDKLIEYRYFDVWDGKLPEIMPGEGGTMLQIPTE